MSKQGYRFTIQWNHRKWGPQMEKTAAEGTSLRRALNKALHDFFSNKSKHHERRDAHTDLQVHAWRPKKTKSP